MGESMTKKEAAAFLGVSERAVNRYITRGRLSVTYRKKEGGSQEAVFDPDEVAVLKTQIDTPKPPPSKSEALTAPDSGKMVKGDKGVNLQAFLSAVAEATTTPRAVPIEAKLTLTLRDASKLSGLSRGYLLEAIKGKKLKAAKRGRGWNIKRADLEAWVSKL